MAVPLEVAKFTSNAAVPPLRVTVKVATFVPLSPSLIVTLLIETEPAIAAASSLVMVPTP